MGSLLYKLAHKLTSEERTEMPKGEFVFPKEKRYPIEDKNHARNALARVSANGTPSEKAKVESAVHSKYPNIGKEAAYKLGSLLALNSLESK